MKALKSRSEDKVNELAAKDEQIQQLQLQLAVRTDIINIVVINLMWHIFLLLQAADELREQEVRQKNDKIQQKSALLEQIQVLNPVLVQVCIPLPILSLFLVQQDHNNINMHDCGLLFSRYAADTNLSIL